MTIFLIILSLLNLSAIGFNVWFTYKVKKRVDSIFSVDLPEGNEATKVDNSTVELSEQNILSIPQDVKFEVEGGDENIPPGWTKSKPAN